MKWCAFQPVKAVWSGLLDLDNRNAIDFFGLSEDVTATYFVSWVVVVKHSNVLLTFIFY